MRMEHRIRQFRERVRGREVGSEDTLDDYTTWIRRYLVWADGRQPSEAALRDFDSFLADPQKTDYPWDNPRGRGPPQEYAYRTRVKALSAVKLWYKSEHDVRVPTEVQNLCLGEADDFDPTILPPAEINETITNAPLACDHDGCDVAIRVGYDAIMRGVELTRVRWEDFDRQAGTLYVRAAKRSNRITLQLQPVTASELAGYMDDIPQREHVFQNAYGRKWDPDAWSEHFRNAHNSAGFHAIARHSAIVHRLEAPERFADMNPDRDVFGQVYRRARHKHPSMTIRYAKHVGIDVDHDWIDD